MKEVCCIEFHKPDEGKYGDCLRACVATILELPRENVPHFYGGGVDEVEATKAFNTFLSGRGLTSVHVKQEGLTVDDIIGLAGDMFVDIHGVALNGDHAVVVKNGSIVWNPSAIQTEFEDIDGVTPVVLFFVVK